MSDNGPQMRSRTACEFMAACAIMQRFGRRSTPSDQARIESLVSHVKGEWPQLEKIRNPAMLQTELDRARDESNQVRLDAGTGLRHPDDEHHGDAIRQARRDGLVRARAARIPTSSQPDRGNPMTVHRTWPGISTADWCVH